MALLSLTFISTFATAQGAFASAPGELAEEQRTVRAEAIVPIPGLGSRNTGMYQIEIGHKGELQGNLPDAAASSEQLDEVVTLSGHARSVHDGLQVLRIQQEEPPKQGCGCAVAGLGLILASLVGIAMKLNEEQDPYADLRGSTKPLAWVRMGVYSSIDAFDEGLPAKITKLAQHLADYIGCMASKALRKSHAKLRRMARPNLAKCDFGEGHEDLKQGVQFVSEASSEEDSQNLLGDSAPLLTALPAEPKPSELAGMTMEALAQQLEKAGQDELAAQMLSNNSKSLGSLAMAQSHSKDCESESECVI